MRILFLSFPYAASRGGGERYTEQTVDGLMRAGHEAFLVSSARPLLTSFKKRGWHARFFWCGLEPVTPLSVLLFPLSVIACVPMLFILLAWFRFARGTRALVCLSLTEKLIATPIARLFGMRVFWVEHLIAGRSIQLNPFRGWYAASSRLARVITVSQAAANALAEVGVPRERVTVIYPGVAPTSARAGVPMVVGTISRLSPEKNISLLLRAFALVVKEIPEANLEIFGDGPERVMLENAAHGLGIEHAVTFHGYVENASECGQFSVLAAPSAKEAFGMAALETMARGIPVVATRVGGLPEVIADGETGILTPPNDERALADAIIKLLRDRELAARMGEAGRGRAARLFSEEKMQNAWNALFS